MIEMRMKKSKEILESDKFISGFTSFPAHPFRRI